MSCPTGACQRAVLGVLGCLAGTVAAGGPARSEQVIYPATNCERFSGPSASAYYGRSGGVANKSLLGETLTLLCPVPGKNAWAVSNLQFYSVDNSPFGSVCCRFEWHAPGGSTTFQSASKCAAAGASSVTMPVTNSIPFGGYAMLVCDVPSSLGSAQEAKLQSYLVTMP